MSTRQLAGRLANARHFDPELVGDVDSDVLAERIKAVTGTCSRVTVPGGQNVMTARPRRPPASIRW
jgi:hypothetical protein